MPEEPEALEAARRSLSHGLQQVGRPGGEPVSVELRVGAGLRACCEAGYRAHPVLMTLFGLWPLWPDSGDALLNARLRARASPGTGPARSYQLDLEVRVPYSVYWYGHLRSGPRDEAFRAAWSVLQDELSARLSGWIESSAASPASPPSSRSAPALPPAPSLATSTGEAATSGRLELTVRDHQMNHLSSGLVLERKELFAEDPDRWRVITAANAPRRERPQSFLARYFSALGGVDAGYLMGRAWVSSSATDSFGQRYTVASGEARTRGFRVDLYTIPEQSSWFLYPTIGFLSQDIDIKDFRENVPLSAVAGAREIPGVGSNPETGAPVDLGDPNVYQLFLRSAYIGQRLSATLVMGTPRVQLFGVFEGGFNIIEFRHARVRLGNYETEGWSFPWFFSGQLRAIAGVAIRPWHVALRCEAHYEAYRSYAFPEPLEFMGRLEYNAEKQKHERRRTWVESASVGVANLFFSANIFY